MTKSTLFIFFSFIYLIHVIQVYQPMIKFRYFWLTSSALRLEMHIPFKPCYSKFMIFSHTQRVSVTSNHPVSVVIVVVGVVVVGVNFFSFSTSSLKPLYGFASNFVWMFLGWTPTKFVHTQHGIWGKYFNVKLLIIFYLYFILKKIILYFEKNHILFGNLPVATLL